MKDQKILLFYGEVINENVANVNINATSSVGGLIGKSERGDSVAISDNKSTGHISAVSSAGGLIGETFIFVGGGSGAVIRIERNYSEVNIEATGDMCGGLIGYVINQGNTWAKPTTLISKCYSVGNVISDGNYIGGLIGYARSIGSTGSDKGAGGRTNINDCFELGSVKGNDWCGGLIGYAEASGTGTKTVTVDRAYVYGNTTGITENVHPVIGGAYEDLGYYRYGGASVSTITYFIPETIGITESKYGTSKNLSNMYTQSEFTNWDFESTWTIEEGVTMPYLKNIDKPDGVNK